MPRSPKTLNKSNVACQAHGLHPSKVDVFEGCVNTRESPQAHLGIFGETFSKLVASIFPSQTISGDFDPLL